MPIRSLCAVAFGCLCLVACGGGSSKGGSGGSGPGGTGTGGANGATFMAIAPCNSESDYQMATTVTFPNGDDTYAPACLKVAVNSSVAFTPMAGANFLTYPLAPSAMRGNTSDNPIQMVENNSTAPRSFDFGVPGFFGFYCITTGGDSDGAGMAGVVWVQ